MQRYFVLIIGVAIGALGTNLNTSAAVVTKDLAAIEELRAGKRTDANAAWWGFDAEDATDAIQGAINSGAKRVVIPNLGKDWIVKPIRLAGDQELFLERGVNVVAKRGEFRGGGDMLFYATDVANLTIRGYGATLRMQKEDYIVGIVLKDLKWNRWFGQYPKAEWRTSLGLRGCTNVQVLGIRLADSGGDGIYIDGSRVQRFCKDVVLKDVTCDNHYRQGISVISVDGLTVDNCAFNNTWGTPPSSGVDFEPDTADQRLKHIVFRNCRFDDNYGDGIEVFLAHLNSSSEPVSMLFENCRVTSRRGPGIRVTKLGDDSPGGLIEFRDCIVAGTEGYGIKVQDKSTQSAQLKFVRCTLRDVARNRNYQANWAPIWLHAKDTRLATSFGSIDFIDCVVEDEQDRAAISVTKNQPVKKLVGVRGTISVRNPNGVRAELDDPEEKQNLTVKPAEGS